MFKSIFHRNELLQIFVEILEYPNLLKKLDSLDTINEANQQILKERLDSFSDAQLKILGIGAEKKEFNKLTAIHNGITIEQLIASPNYEHLIEEYKVFLVIRYTKDCINSMNSTFKDLGSEINFSEGEIEQIANIINKNLIRSKNKTPRKY